MVSANESPATELSPWKEQLVSKGVKGWILLESIGEIMSSYTQGSNTPGRSVETDAGGEVWAENGDCSSQIVPSYCSCWKPILLW